jgi:hypothetical protein
VPIFGKLPRAPDKIYPASGPVRCFVTSVAQIAQVFGRVDTQRRGAFDLRAQPVAMPGRHGSEQQIRARLAVISIAGKTCSRQTRNAV